MPVIQYSAGGEFGDFGSAMRHRLVGKADPLGRGVHVYAQVRMREGNVSERECRVAPRFAADADLSLGEGKTGTFVNYAGLDFQQLAWRDKTPHLGFLDHGEKR